MARLFNASILRRIAAYVAGLSTCSMVGGKSRMRFVAMPTPCSSIHRALKRS